MWKEKRQWVLGGKVACYWKCYIIITFFKNSSATAMLLKIVKLVVWVIVAS